MAQIEDAGRTQLLGMRKENTVPQFRLFKLTCLLCWHGLSHITRADHTLNSTVNKHILLLAWVRRSFPALVFPMSLSWDNWNILGYENVVSPSSHTEVPPKLELGSQEKPCPSSWMFLTCQWLDRETAGILLSTREDLQRNKVSHYVILRETCTIRGAGNRERHLWSCFECHQGPTVIATQPIRAPAAAALWERKGGGKDWGEDSQGCITFPGQSGIACTTWISAQTQEVAPIYEFNPPILSKSHPF